MVDDQTRAARRWGWFLSGWLLIALGTVVHAAAGVAAPALAPVAEALRAAVGEGWVRAGAGVALTGGVFLVVTAWPRRPAHQGAAEKD